MKNRLLLLFVLIAGCVGTRTTASSYQFTRINTDNSNLSYNGVSRFFQDSRGFIWVGTYRGLNRYDGAHFEVYGREELGLNSDYIFCIKEDKGGNLWIGTDGGVTKYNYQKDRFEPFSTISDKDCPITNKVVDIMVDEEGLIWFLVNDQGVFRYNPSLGSLTLSPYSSFGYGINGFGRILRTPSGMLCMSCYYYNLFLAEGDMSNIRPLCRGEYASYFSADEVKGLFNADEESIYVVSRNNGLTRVNTVTGVPEQLFKIPHDMFLLDACYDEKNADVWLSTSKGAWKYNVDTGEAVLLQSDSDDSFSLSDIYVSTIFVDKEDGLWVGTKNGGVNYCPAEEMFERQYRVSGKMLTGFIINGFAGDDEGGVWITTDRGVILKYDYQSHLLSETGILFPDYVCSPCYQAPYLWFGSMNGLKRMDTRTGSIKNYDLWTAGSRQNDPRVYLVEKTESGELIVGNTLGLFAYNKSEDAFYRIPVFDGIFVTDIAEDRDHCLWMASYANGVYKWRFGSGEPPVHYSLYSGTGEPVNRVYSMFVDSSDRVWAVGFSHGLSYLDRESDEFRRVKESVESLFPSSIAFSMLEDSGGWLWFSTDKGLVQFNPDTEEVKVYSKKNGLLDNRLTNGALILPDGDMLFSSENGFIRFNPSGLYPSKESPRVSITGFSVADKPLENGINVDLAAQIVLRHNENTFGIDVSVLEMRPPLSLRTQCMLEGFDDDWRTVTSGSPVNYYSVPAGHYNFLIRSSLANGEWEAVHAPLEVIIRPPFWGSTIGIILLILIIAAITATALFFSARYSKHRMLEAEKERNRIKEEELLQEKMNFFSHVVHEIKTPLTLIKTPLGNVIDRETVLDEESRLDLKVMKDNTDYLSKLVNELLEFVRIERKGYVLNLERMDMVQRLKEMVFDYMSTARSANIKLSFTPVVSSIIVHADVSAMNKILNNVLLNAVKYAESRVEIRARVEDKTAIIDFLNDGPLIPENFRDKVFNVFVQIDRGNGESSSGVGIGLPLARNLARMHSGDLALSTVDSMTCFTLSIPVCEIEQETQEWEESLPDNHKPVLVFADDNNDLRDYLQTKLSEYYEVITVPNSDAAMHVIRENNVDFLVTDISMPGKSGLELCREIRSDVIISHLPIIILSARASVESKIQAMEAGADLYIEKPFDLAYLMTSIRNILDRRVLMRNAFKSGLFSTDISMFGLPKRDEDFFDKFNTLINENLASENLGVEWLSEKMNVSQSTLTRKIKKMLNTTPKNYIRSVRLAKAAEMLRDSHGNSITDICYATGFSSVSYFAKCFKEQYGKVPTEYAA